MKRLAIAVLSVLTLFATAASAITSCPSSEYVDPCTCKQMATGLHVVCANVEDSADMARAFKVLRNYQLQNVLLHRLSFTEVLPSDLFSGLIIEDLKVENSDLKFSQPAFTGLEESLKTLSVSKSVIKTPENSVAVFGKLEELRVKEVSLGKVTDHWLNGKIPNVRILILDDNEITDVESKAFAELKYLVKFSASGNGIKEIARSMGPRPALYLESLDFSFNEISDLPADLFSDSPKLTTVVVSGNNLKTVSEATWSGVWEQLDTALFFENNLECDGDMNWLRKVKWPRQVTGNCVLPNALVGKSLIEVYKPK